MERKLTAILCADVYGYSRLMGEDEEATHRILISHRKIIDSLIEQRHGRFVNSAGDSVLAEFASVVNAVQCAVEVQSALKVENASLAAERRMEFRIGVNLGDVIVDGEQIYGDGVNVAARLESLADPGGICISGTVHDQVRDRLPLVYHDAGEQAVKNITRPVRVWRVLLDGTVPSRGETRRIARRYWHGGVLSLAGLMIILAMIVLVQHVSFKPPRTHASIPPPPTPALTLPDKPSIAVLPFTNMSDDREQEYFSDGITDDLITDLSRLPDLFVIARDSTFTYKGKPTKLQDISKELGVKYVLEGGVRKAADQVRITVQLADATTGTELWAERYDRPLRDVFALQDEIVRRIVTTLNLQLALSQKGIVIPRTTENLEAYDDLLRGTEYSVSLTKEGNAKARRFFEKAIELDPKYAAAYAQLGWNYYFGAGYGLNPDPNGIGRGLRVAQQALTLDDSLASAHCVIAGLDEMNEQYDEAAVETQRAIALDPNNAFSYLQLAGLQNLQVKPTEALVLFEKATRLDPRNADVYMEVQGWAYMELGWWKGSIPALKQYLTRFPYDIYAMAFLANDYSFLGDEDAARAQVAAVERLVALTPNASEGYVPLSWALNSLGKPAEALVAVNTAIRLDPRRLDFCVCHLRFRGVAFTLLGRWREAIDAFNLHLTHFPHNFWAHAYLAVDYMELGRDGSARAEVEEVQRLDPQLTVDMIFPTVSLDHKAFPTEIDRFRGDLHKAGLK
jgi:adenylate cyclase